MVVAVGVLFSFFLIILLFYHGSIKEEGTSDDSHEQRERMMMVLNASNESLKASLKQLQDETQVETDSLRQEIRYVFKLGYILV
jgi:hypothetical protein